MKPEEEAKTERLVGKYFRSANETNKVEWQGAVIAEPHSGWYLVQLLEWGSGEPKEQRLVPIEKMMGWSFYPDMDAMMSSSKRSLVLDSGTPADHEAPHTLASRS
jgi:hypothetical protein